MSPEAYTTSSHRLKPDLMNDDNRIRDVWNDNFLKELELIGELCQTYNYISMVSIYLLPTPR